MASLIEVTGLTKRYGSARGITNLTFEVVTAMLLIGAAMLTLGTWRFSTRDLDRGAVET